MLKDKSNCTHVYLRQLDSPLEITRSGTICAIEGGEWDYINPFDVASVRYRGSVNRTYGGRSGGSCRNCSGPRTECQAASSVAFEAQTEQGVVQRALLGHRSKYRGCWRSYIRVALVPYGQSLPFTTVFAIVESRGKPRPSMPLISSLNVTLDEFTRPNACCGTVRLLRSIVSRAIKPEAATQHH